VGFLGDKGEAGGAAAEAPSFGDRLGSFMTDRYPVAGGLANSVFGTGQAPAAQAPPQDIVMSPSSSLIEMNAKPKSSGLGELVKLLAGG
jgi:hypothetical protein